MKAVLALVILYVGTFLVAIAGHSQRAQQSKPDSAAQDQQVKSPAAAPMDPAKEAAIRSLLELNGASDLIEDAALESDGQFSQRIETLMPDKNRAQKLSTALVEPYKTHFASDELTNQLLHLYDKHFTAEEIKQLLQFYGSPIGQKFAAEMPKLTQEAQTAGMSLSQQAGREGWKDLREQSPDLAQAQRFEHGDRHQQ
jgi:hypothetical protein